MVLIHQILLGALQLFCQRSSLGPMLYPCILVTFNLRTSVIVSRINKKKKKVLIFSLAVLLLLLIIY